MSYLNQPKAVVFVRDSKLREIVSHETLTSEDIETLRLEFPEYHTTHLLVRRLLDEIATLKSSVDELKDSDRYDYDLYEGEW
jgi:hypothetical protein